MNAPHDLPVKPMRAKRCKAPSCRQPFTPARPLQVACSPLCAIELIAKAKAKKHEAAMKAERKALREKRERLKTRSDHLREAQAVFNRYIRFRDQLAGHPCISSGEPLDWSGNNVDAGHYRSRGSAPHLRFNEDNCHAQSKKENRYASGNAIDYRINLIRRIGLARVEALEADQTPRKWTIPDLLAIKATYQQKIKELTR